MTEVRGAGEHEGKRATLDGFKASWPFLLNVLAGVDVMDEMFAFKRWWLADC